MKIKVCGIRTKGNLHYLKNAKIDMIGFIFYDQSKRFFDDGELAVNDMLNVKKQKVGVFVNASKEEVFNIIDKYQLDAVQLHGEESPDYCLEISKKNVLVLKAFSVKDKLPNNLKTYEQVVDLFLFDTKGVEYGGNGVQFDWSILENYDLDRPFMVSGGIGPEDVEKLKNIKNKKLEGVDINSRFEIEPGLKDEVLIDRFVNEIKR